MRKSFIQPDLESSKQSVKAAFSLNREMQSLGESLKNTT